MLTALRSKNSRKRLARRKTAPLSPACRQTRHLQYRELRDVLFQFANCSQQRTWLVSASYCNYIYKA